MRKKTKRIFDDIIIGLKGKDALACLESLEKIQKDFLQDRDSLEGIQKKIDSYPLRYRIIYKGFCNQWSLAELNAALQEKNEKLESKQNYMTVPAVIKELEKIEMTRQTDNVYRLDHAVTAKQKKS